MDEVSQCDIGVWHQLCKLTRLTNAPRFLLSGDGNQFPPIANAWRGVSVGDQVLWKSELLRHLAAGHYVELDVCVRSDRVLYDFYRSLIMGGTRCDMSLTRAVQDAKQTFKYEGPCETYLVISHARRVQINRDENLKQVKALGLAPMLFVDIKATRARRASAQSFWAYVGQQLLGCTSSGERMGIRNCVAYRVKALDLQNKTMELEGVRRT